MIARGDHGVQRGLFVGGIALHRGDQIGHQIVALAQLGIDIPQRLPHVLAQTDQPVVNPHDQQPDQQEDGHGNDNFHLKLLPATRRHRPWLPISLGYHAAGEWQA